MTTMLAAMGVVG